MSFLAITGCYTRKEMHVHGIGEGINVYRGDESSGALEKIAGPFKESGDNPSYVCVHPSNKFVYAVSETADSMVSAFALDRATGQLQFLNKQSAGGDACCYIEVSKDGKWLLAANYCGGTVSVLPIEENGHLSPVVSNPRFTEFSGANAGRQEASHMHCLVLSPSNEFALAADLGADAVYCFAFNKDGKGSLELIGKGSFRPGGGPRHLVWHPTLPIVYVLRELDSIVSVCRFDGKDLHEEQEISMLPADCPSPSTTTGAAIRISQGDGGIQYVLASNRGDDSVAVFRVDGEGMLSVVDFFSTAAGIEGLKTWGIDGSTECPRDVSLHGSLVFAANQNSGTITIFKRDMSNGRLDRLGGIPSGTPTSVCFVPL